MTWNGLELFFIKLFSLPCWKSLKWDLIWMNVCNTYTAMLASIMCSVIGSVKTFFRPLSLSPPLLRSSLQNSWSREESKKCQILPARADVFHDIDMNHMAFLYISNVDKVLLIFQLVRSDWKDNIPFFVGWIENTDNWFVVPLAR